MARDRSRILQIRGQSDWALKCPPKGRGTVKPSASWIGPLVPEESKRTADGAITPLLDLLLPKATKEGSSKKPGTKLMSPDSESGA